MPAPATDPVVAQVTSCDGAARPVYEDRDGGRYICYDNDGAAFRFVWWMPQEADEPTIVESTERRCR